MEERRVRSAQTREDTAAAILNVLAESRTASMPNTRLRAEVTKEMGCSKCTYDRAYRSLVMSGEVTKKQLTRKDGERGWYSVLSHCSGTNA